VNRSPIQWLALVAALLSCGFRCDCGFPPGGAGADDGWTDEDGVSTHGDANGDPAGDAHGDPAGDANGDPAGDANGDPQLGDAGDPKPGDPGDTIHWACATSSDDVLVSTNGVEWNLVALPDPGIDVATYDIAWGDRWVLVAEAGYLTYSDDALTWAMGSGTWLAAGSNAQYSISTDGTPWTAAEILPGFNESIYTIAWADGVWFVGGRVGTYATAQTLPTFTVHVISDLETDDAEINGVDYDGTRWIIGADFGHVASNPTHPPTGAWTDIDPINEESKDVCFGGGVWVVVGDDRHVASSDGAASWTSAQLDHFIDSGGSDNNIQAVVYGAGRWVIAGDLGKIMTAESANDVLNHTWTPATVTPSSYDTEIKQCAFRP